MKFALCAPLGALCASIACGPAWAAPPPPEPLSAAARAKIRTNCQPGDSGFFRDQGLTMKLASKLKFKKGLLSEQIDARVTSGVATLSGGLSTQQSIHMALNIAAEVEGVHCIHNFMRVGPAAPSPGGAD